MNAVLLHGLPHDQKQTAARMLRQAGVEDANLGALLASLPFGPGDATCGCENELQAVVVGDQQSVDLPCQVFSSNYFRNLLKRHHRGEMPRQAVSDLERWLTQNHDGVWENSWVRIPREVLSPLALEVFERDLLADKSRPQDGRRGDWRKFILEQDGRSLLRVPVSYLLKLSLVQALGCQPELPAALRAHGLSLAEHFLSDNTSPETYSFAVAQAGPEAGLGRQVSRETARRFLLTQLLTQFAERGMGLLETGQRVLVYFAPHPPVRQKQLAACISDAFYRELFMNPCLSGWERGGDKQRYMHLCHEVLTRAQFNALGRLKEAGIILNDLVALPSASNISLANNGTHVSLGSRRLSAALADPASGLGAPQEKYLGDLVIKFVEHFLPLFVGSYSAAPYRLAFRDFHPEKVLSFLPYQLDYTHLRMLWRRWKKKASLNLRPLGLRLTPFGPPWLDQALSRLFGLRGDLVPDFRLLDYLVAVLSTDQCPALDGTMGNQERLKQDLADQGVFNPSMPIYLLYRQRAWAERGFAGFEGRHYSLFPSLEHDLGRASDLQLLLTALAFQLIASGRLAHAHLPDDPETESERRQIFFGAAVGLPTFFVREGSRNRVLRSILQDTQQTRHSRRYAGYLRVKHDDYRSAAARFICREGRELIQALGLEDTMLDLLQRLERPQHRSAAAQLSRGVLEQMGQRDPLRARAEEFNRAAEAYYRDSLRTVHLREAWEVLAADLRGPLMARAQAHPELRDCLRRVLGDQEPGALLDRSRGAVLAGRASASELTRLINLILIVTHLLALEAAGADKGEQHGTGDAPVPRTAYR